MPESPVVKDSNPRGKHKSSVACSHRGETAGRQKREEAERSAVSSSGGGDRNKGAIHGSGRLSKREGSNRRTVDRNPGPNPNLTARRTGFHSPLPGAKELELRAGVRFWASLSNRRCPPLPRGVRTPRCKSPQRPRARKCLEKRRGSKRRFSFLKVSL